MNLKKIYIFYRFHNVAVNMSNNSGCLSAVDVCRFSASHKFAHWITGPPCCDLVHRSAAVRQPVAGAGAGAERRWRARARRQLHPLLQPGNDRGSGCVLLFADAYIQNSRHGLSVNGYSSIPIEGIEMQPPPFPMEVAPVVIALDACTSAFLSLVMIFIIFPCATTRP